ncbi:MAG TPA: hypothetical protein PK542_12070, partial [Treponemataceae bacterium]|nr:hypothetical protein [Treponemataceae bacterium]
MKTHPFSAGRTAGRIAAALGLLALASLPLRAEQFRFKFAEGDSYRINSVVHETVYLNRALSHQAEITNRITVDVSDVRAAAAGELASAL